MSAPQITLPRPAPVPPPAPLGDAVNARIVAHYPG